MSNKASIFKIISEWSEQYGDRFRKSYRKTAIEQLVLTLKEAGYEPYEIKSAKKDILKRAVGPRSKFGATALKEWRDTVEDEFDRVWSKYFEEGEVALVDIGDIPQVVIPIVVAPPESASETAETALPSNNYIEEIEATQQTSGKEWVPKSGERYAPEMDRSAFKDIETTPVESDEEFMRKMGLK